MCQSLLTRIFCTIVLLLKALRDTVCIIILLGPCALLRLLVVSFVKVFRRNYHLLNHLGVLLEDDFTRKSTNLSHLSILTIDGDLTLPQVKLLFENNVLNCEHPEGGRLRYPELQMYLVRLLGTWFWKPDINFKIEDYIFETIYQGELPPPEVVFEDYLNRTFSENKSPWQLSLIKSSTGCRRSLLVLKMHHSMSDGKSVVKLIVECLAGKILKTASAAKPSSKPLMKKLFNLISFPYNFALGIYVKCRLFELKTMNHPWRIRNIDKDTSPFIVKTTEKILLQDVKSIGKQNSVPTSSVIMALISGAIRNFDKNAAAVPGGFPMLCTLPKPNHPPNLTNHLFCGFPFLPTDIMDAQDRVRKCNDVYMKVKQDHFPALLDMGVRMIANIVSPHCKSYFPQDAFTTGLTNIAGDDEGFSVGGFPCVDFNFCVSIPNCAAGVGFVIFSYKNSLRVTVVAKSSILSEKQISKLANLVEMEMEVLMRK